MLLVGVLVYPRLYVYFYPVYRIVHLLYVTCFMYFLPHRSSFIFYLLYLLFIMRAFHFCSGVSLYVSYIYMLTSPVMGFMPVGDMPNKHKHKHKLTKKAHM